MSECFIHIKSGIVANPNVLRRQIKDLKDGSYSVKIEKKNKRTLPQNAYYHGIICEQVKDGLRDAGYYEVQTKADAHEVLKTLFLKRKIVNRETDEVIEVAGSTTKLTVIEFGEYIERIIQWAGEYLGITILAPNTQSEIFYK